MLSSKLLPEMEVDYNSKSEQWLQGMQNLPIFSQIEKLKVDQSSFCIEYIIIVSLYSGTFIYLVLQARIDMTAAACESAEKVLEDTREASQFGTPQGPATLPTLDKSQAAKIQERESLLRAAVINVGDDYHLNCQYSCFVRSSCSSFLAGAFKF